MRIRYLFGLLAAAIILTVASCKKRYFTTVKVCSDSLYVEIFLVTPSGEYTEYLTDSANFRIHTTSFDAEEEACSYSCKGDSILVDKHTLAYKSADHRSKSLSKTVYSLRELKKERRFD